MSRFRLNVGPGALLVLAVCLPAAPAAAQTPAQVRVVDRPARIQRWFRPPVTEVVLQAEPGTTLDVLDRDRDWYWVLLPPNAYGTRKDGWVRVRDVEAVVPPPRREEPPPQAAAAPAPVAEDKVTITTAREEPAPATAGAAKPYTFDDVHFDRDKYSLREEDVAVLRSAVVALKADPSLVVNIEGHTCNIGAAAYNRALGLRRANAVRDFLVSEGIAADRLHAVSMGEENPKYDNSREETRKLNRRVALVPDGQR